MSRGQSLVLDRQFKGVGRLKRATGTTDKHLFRLLDAMLDTLYRAGRVDLLQAIQQGKMHPLTVWSRYRLGQADQLPTAESMRPLKEEMEAWVEKSDTGVWNRASRRYGVRALLKRAPVGVTLEDLPDLLRGYSTTAQGNTMFNRSRSAVQAFLRDTLGKSHPLYARVRDVRAKRVRTREGNPQTPEQLTELTAKLHPALAEMAWSMALTGMLPHEYWGSWTIYPNRIHVHGTKREGRKRDIPLIRPISKPTRLYKPLLLALRDASGHAVLVKDLRNTYATWLKNAGIERIRRKIYYGHGKVDVSDIYEWETAQAYLISDAEKLRLFLGENVGKVTLTLHSVGGVSA